MEFDSPLSPHPPVLASICLHISSESAINLAVDIDIRVGNRLFSNKKEVIYSASVLYEMPLQEGNERRQVYHHEEWEVGYSGCMPHLWHKDVQNREGITLII